MQLAKFSILFAGAILLTGCLPLSQSPTATSIAPQSERGVLYGSAEPVYLPRTVASATPARPRKVEVATTSPVPSAPSGADASSKSDATVVYSDEWWKREKDTDSRLSQSTKICRC